MIRVPFDELQAALTRTFEARDVPTERAATLGTILATNSLEGVPSHGAHFAPLILRGLRDGHIDPGAEAAPASSFGAWEQWRGHQAPGPLSALRASTRATELARAHGVGVVALRDTNHWTRPGYYGQEAARAGFALICWANTPFVMPPWGATKPRVGNNPIVFALPHDPWPIVLDMAMSQFSMGRLQTTRLLGEQLPVAGGYDAEGRLSQDPDAVLASGRSLPIGFWKGSGLAILLDLLAATLASGNTTLARSLAAPEDDVSQVFVAFDVAGRLDVDATTALADTVIADLHAHADGEIAVPGEGVRDRRARNLREGVPVDAGVWERLQGGR